jgi:hypothetical protein
MEVFNYLNTVISAVPEQFGEHIVLFIFAIVFMLLLTGFNIYLAWEFARKHYKKIGRIFYVIITILVCILMLPISVVFIIADEISELNPGIINNRFLVESVIIIILFTVFEAIVTWIVLKKKELERDKTEVAKIQGKIIFGVICVGVTVLFIFTDAESTLQGWGFSLFGKSLGQWVFNGYLASILTFLLNFAKEIILIPFMMIFGNPYVHLQTYIEDK